MSDCTQYSPGRAGAFLGFTRYQTDFEKVLRADTDLVGMRPWLIKGNFIRTERNAQVAAIVGHFEEEGTKTTDRSAFHQSVAAPCLRTEKLLGTPDFLEGFNPSRLGLDIPNPLCMRKREQAVDTTRTQSLSCYPSISRQDLLPLLGNVVFFPGSRIVSLVSHVEAFQPLLRLVRVFGCILSRDGISHNDVL